MKKKTTNKILFKILIKTINNTKTTLLSKEDGMVKKNNNNNESWCKIRHLFQKEA